MLGFIMAGCKKEAGVLRVETNSIQNQTGFTTLWLCEFSNNNRINYQTIDTVDYKLTAEVMTNEGETWEVNLGGTNLSGAFTAYVYLEGDVVGYLVANENGGSTFRITIE